MAYVEVPLFFSTAHNRGATTGVRGPRAIAAGEQPVLEICCDPRGRQVPSWLAWWGLIGGGLLLLRGVIEVYGVELAEAAQVALAAPIGIEEMVFAVWLIVKGFTTVVPEPRTTLRRGDYREELGR